MLSVVAKRTLLSHSVVSKCFVSTYRQIVSGELGKDFNYKCQVEEEIDGKFEPISCWHDINYSSIPMLNKKPAIVNFVMEIPRGQSAKTEINTRLSYTPIMQDTKNGHLRFYGAPSMINYGAVPQTWENPHRDELTDIGSFKGDNDPLDIMDFSYICHPVGEVYQVKVFGAIALIDQGEMDWKLLGLNVKDPACDGLRDYCDFFQSFHNDLDKMRTWLRTYKIAEGKGENSLAFDGMPFDERDSWEMVIEPAHKEWEKLIRGDCDIEKLCLDRRFK